MLGGGLAIVTVTVVMVLAIGGEVSDRIESQQAVNAINSEVAAVQRDRLASLDGPPVDEVAHFDRLINAVESRMSRLTEREAVSAKAGVNTLRAMRPHVQAYGLATAELRKGGGFNPAALESTTDIDRWLTKVRKLQEASKTLADKLQTTPELFKSELTAAGVAPARISSELAAFRAAANLDRAQSSFKVDQEACALLTKLLDLLKREWNSWEVDEESHAVRFEKASAANKFNQWSKELMTISQRQLDAQRRYLSDPS